MLTLSLVISGRTMMPIESSRNRLKASSAMLTSRGTALWARHQRSTTP